MNRNPPTTGAGIQYLSRNVTLPFDEKTNQQKYSRHSNSHNAISFNGKYGIDNFERHMKTSFLGNKQLAYFRVLLWQTHEITG